MLKTPSAIILVSFLGLAVLLPAIPAQAIELNPFSIIKGAVEAAVEDRSADDSRTSRSRRVVINTQVL